MSTSAALLLDRFVSASTAADAAKSIQALLESDDLSDIFLSTNNSEGVTALLQVLEGKLNDFKFEEGPALACRICLKLYNIAPHEASKVLLETSLVQTLLDTIDAPTTDSYARVLCLQVMEKICQSSPSIAQKQLLEAPNGLHRLAQLLSSADEQVRNEALLVGMKIAEWPSCAKVWVFEEVCDVTLQLALAEGGLTGGNVVVHDCLEICRNLLKHDSASSADLVLSSSAASFPRNLAALLDLRCGTEFRNPKALSAAREKDDLDDILKSGSSAKEQQPTPRLTDKEEIVLDRVFEILHYLLSTTEHQSTIWKQHPALSSLVWELALVSPPAPGTPYQCAMPSAALQQRALQLVSQCFHDDETMERHNGMDRLLYLVCTGGGATARTWDDKLGLSQSALCVLRSTLDSEKALLLVGHTLTPTGEDEPPTVVQKLINTVAENIEGPPEEGNAMLERRRINLLGSLGALGVFLSVAGDTTRDMLLPIMTRMNLVDSIFQSLEEQDSIVTLALLRLLTEWVQDAPSVVKAILASTYSTSLGVTFSRKNNDGLAETFAGLLLGLLMDGIVDEEGSEGYGGWTKQGILTMISKRKGGISGYTAALESLKTNDKVPWAACKLELQVFQQQCINQVHTVRKCVVKEMTAGGDEEDDDDDNSTEGDASASAGVKSLRRLMSQQSTELLDVQECLSTAQATIKSQKEQLDMWKRRVESNPTQLDEMLSQLASENEKLKRNGEATLKELNQEKLDLIARLKQKDDELLAVRTELGTWKERERESREERDTLRGEMEALSSAYNTLEAEYHRRVGTASTATAAPTEESADGPQYIPGQQPEGEVSRQPTRYDPRRDNEEILTLREENTRLRSEAVAADEWMSMAVQKMNDIGGQNVVLQQQVESFQQQGGHSASSDTAEQHQLRQDLANAKKDVSVALDSLGQSKAYCEQLERKLEILQGELDTAKVDNLSLRENLQMETSKLDGSKKVEELMAEHGALVDAKDNQIELLQQEIESLQQSLMGETNREESFEELSVAVASLRKELADTLKREGEEMQRRDTTILKLEGELVHAQQPRSILQSQFDSDLKKKEEEISQLKSANDAAQEWMAKAVEHHTMLSEQISALQSDKGTLISRVEELLEQLSMSEKKLPTAEKTSADTAKEIFDLQNQLKASENDLSRLREKQVTYEERLRDLVIIETAKVGATRKADELEDELAQTLQEMEQVKSELDSARFEVAQKENMLSDRAMVDSANASMKAEIARLKDDLAASLEKSKEFQNEADELIRLRDTVASLEEKVTAMASNSEILQSELETYRVQNAYLQDKAEELEKAQIAEAKEKAVVMEAVESNRAAYDQDKEELNSLRNENELLRTKCTEHEQTVEGLQSNLDEFKSWTDIAQQRIAQLQSEKTSVEDLEEMKKELELKNNKLNEAIREKDELCISKSSLGAELATLQRENENFEQSCQSLEEKLTAAENHITELKATSSEVKVMENKLTEKERALHEAETTMHELKKELDEVKEQSKDVIKEWQERAGELEASVNDLEQELEQQQQEATDAVAQWEDRCSALEQQCTTLGDQLRESDVNQLEEELEAQQREATEAVSQWEERCSQLQERRAHLEVELRSQADEQLRKEREFENQLRNKDEALSDAEGALKDVRIELEEFQSQSEDVIRQWKERVGKLESNAVELEQQLDEQQHEASDVISQWESRCLKLQNDIEGLQTSFDELCRDQVAKGDSLAEAEAVADEGKKLIADLEKELESHRSQIGRLQAELVSKDSLIELRSSEVDGERVTWEGERASLEAENNELKASLASLEQDMDKMTSDFTDFKEQSEDVVNQWKERTDELLVNVTELEDQLAQQEIDANDAISKWESRCSELYERSMQLETETENASSATILSLRNELSSKKSIEKRFQDEQQSWETKRSKLEEENNRCAATIASLEATLDNERSSAGMIERIGSDLEAEKAAKVKAEKALGEELQKTRALEKELHTLKSGQEGQTAIHAELKVALMAKAEAEEALEAGRLRENESEARWNRERDSFEKEKSSLLKHVAELKNEAQQATEMLQACVTDEVSEKATQIATTALRGEVEHMRSQLSGDRQAHAAEKEARLNAESEVDRLRSDLAVLLQLNDEAEDTDGASQRLTFKVADKVRRKERKQIEELRTALERALQELIASQEREKRAEECAATARVKASAFEQEILTAKSDLVFVSQTMEEMREAEASVRASLEHRISELEDDREIVQRLHADEMDNLKTEISHVGVERDRVLQLLKESERKNETLKKATTFHVSHEEENPASELIRLRVEKAQLLEEASEEATSTEHRIREIVAVRAAVVEADIIVEQEMRAAAEASLEETKRKLEELSRREKEWGGSSASEAVNQKHERDIKLLKDETRQLKEENTALQVQLNSAEAGAKATVAAITEQCRKAEAKAHRLERDGYFDSEVNVEIASLRAESSSRSGAYGKADSWVVVNENPAEEHDTDLSATQAFDYIQKQKEEIREERAMYSELLAEQEDLFALLAQQDLQNSSLISSLERTAGSDAVDEAIKEAEKVAIDRYGKFVRLYQRD